MMAPQKLSRTQFCMPIDSVERPEYLLGDAGLMKELKIKLMERMLGAELTAHLGYEEGKEVPPGQGNRRNGTSTKVLKGQDGEMPVAVPRDRDSSFEPELVKKGQTRIDGMDDKIIGLYAAGLTVRDIQAHLLDLYGLKVSPDLISRVTDAVLDEVREWQSRALERMYPIVIFDALRVKLRDADSRTVKNKAVYVALGVTRDGQREVLGLWIAENEGAKFWLAVMNELKNRGTQDILIAVVDGLKGFPEAITAAFPEAMVQTCVRHRSRTDGDQCLTASGAPFPEFLFLEGPQGRGRRPAPGSQRPDRRYGRGRARCLRGEMGREIRLHRPGLAPGLAGGDPVLWFRSRDPQDHLHHECHRKSEPRHPEIYRDTGLVLDRRGRDQADLPCNPQIRKGWPKCPGMVCRPQSVRHNVRQALRRLSI